MSQIWHLANLWRHGLHMIPRLESARGIRGQTLAHLVLGIHAELVLTALDQPMDLVLTLADEVVREPHILVLATRPPLHDVADHGQAPAPNRGPPRQLTTRSGHVLDHEVDGRVWTRVLVADVVGLAVRAVGALAFVKVKVKVLINYLDKNKLDKYF